MNTTSRQFIDGKPAPEREPEPDKRGHRLAGCGEEGRNLRVTFIGGAALVVDRGVARRLSAAEADWLAAWVGVMGEAIHA